LKNKINDISEKFRQDNRLLDSYVDDIRKAIKEFNKQCDDLKNYMESGGSIEVEPKKTINDDGKVSIAMGIADNQWSREAISFGLNNRVEQLKQYIDLSLTMAFTYLLTTFDAKYIDVIKVYFNSISETFPEDVTVEKKLMKFAYKSVSRQVASLKMNYDIDFEKILGKSTIDSLIEIRETRNIHVHNSGVVNRIYLDNVTNTTKNEGEYRTIDETYLESSKETIQRFFYELTHQIELKLN